jgi:hypothetical protein
MELKITELENSSHNSFDFDNYSHSTYWDAPSPPPIEEKKKTVTFNDILSNMSLVVNKHGILEPVYLERENNPGTNNIQMSNNNNIQKKNVDNSVKHSYIYNKYFKDYVQENTDIPEVKVPKTIEEYRQMLLEERIKNLREKKRIQQIKSTKLLFTDNSGVKSKNIISTKNNLRSMNFN